MVMKIVRIGLFTYCKELDFEQKANCAKEQKLASVVFSQLQVLFLLVTLISTCPFIKSQVSFLLSRFC